MCCCVLLERVGGGTVGVAYTQTSPSASRSLAPLTHSSLPPAPFPAQIHAGGRGKGTFDNGFKGGVKICTTAAQVAEYTAKMLGARLVTKQTGPAGQLVTKVLVNEGITIHRELYFAILMDRAFNGPVLVASTQGGMDIEEVAEKSPGAILKEPVDITTGLLAPQALGLAEKLGLKGPLAVQAAAQFQSLYKMFVATDATQVGGDTPMRPHCY